jgi:hypothetical protein
MFGILNKVGINNAEVLGVFVGETVLDTNGKELLAAIKKQLAFNI